MGCIEDLMNRDFSEFIAACHRAEAFGLQKFSSGNMSWRLDDEYLAVSASRSWLGDLEEKDIAICRISDGECVNGKVPSVETGFHQGIMKNRPKVNTVLHFQSPAATTFCCGDAQNVNFNVIPEVPFYVGPVGYVDYIMPSTPELAVAVNKVMLDHDLAILQNHGLVAVGDTFDHLLQRCGFFELACDILLRGGDMVKALSPKEVDVLLSIKYC